MLRVRTPASRPSLLPKSLASAVTIDGGAGADDIAVDSPTAAPIIKGGDGDDVLAARGADHLGTTGPSFNGGAAGISWTSRTPSRTTLYRRRGRRRPHPRHGAVRVQPPPPPIRPHARGPPHIRRAALRDVAGRHPDREQERRPYRRRRNRPDRRSRGRRHRLRGAARTWSSAARAATRSTAAREWTIPGGSGATSWSLVTARPRCCMRQGPRRRRRSRRPAPGASRLRRPTAPHPARHVLTRRALVAGRDRGVMVVVRCPTDKAEACSGTLVLRVGTTVLAQGASRSSHATRRAWAYAVASRAGPHPGHPSRSKRPRRTTRAARAA